MKKIKIIAGAAIVLISGIAFFINVYGGKTETKAPAPTQTPTAVKLDVEQVEYGSVSLEGNIDKDLGITNDTAQRMLGLYYSSSLSDRDQMLLEGRLNTAIAELQQSGYKYRTIYREDLSQNVSSLLPEGTVGHMEIGTGETMIMKQQGDFFTITTFETDSINDKFYTSRFLQKYATLIEELGTLKQNLVFENPFPGVKLNYTILNSKKEVLAKTGDVNHGEMFFIEKSTVLQNGYNNVFIVMDIYNATTNAPIMLGLWNNELIYN